MKTTPNLKTIYVYGDSLVYGFAGVGMGPRYDQKQRFTGILQDLLGDGYDVIEDGLRSRTTDLDDQKLTGRNGLTAFYGNVATQLPFDLLIISLGTNDCKAHLNREPAEVGPALQKYFEALAYNVDLFKAPAPKVLLISPPHINPTKYDENIGKLWFQDQAAVKVKQLAPIIRAVAQNNGAAFLDAAAIVGAGATDGIHLNEDQNKKLAEALAKVVRGLV